MWRILTPSFAQNLSSDGVLSHPEGPARKRKRLTLGRLPLLKPCSAILAHTEEKGPVLSLHLESAKSEQTAQLNSLLKGDEMREMMEGETTLL